MPGDTRDAALQSALAMTDADWTEVLAVLTEAGRNVEETINAIHDGMTHDMALCDGSEREEVWLADQARARLTRLGQLWTKVHAHRNAMDTAPMVFIAMDEDGVTEVYRDGPVWRTSEPGRRGIWQLATRSKRTRDWAAALGLAPGECAAVRLVRVDQEEGADGR